MNRRSGMNWRVVVLAAGLLLPAARVAAASYADLDEKIVRAYNTDPKQMQDVYIYAMQMIERARLDHSSDADAWKEKGEKLVTVSCFSQADKFLNDRNERDAYLWALRGMANGASRGDLGGVEMKQVYEYLKFLVESLKNKLGDQAPYGQTRLEVLDWRRVKKSSAWHKDYRTDPAGRPEPKNTPYQVLSGPAPDSSGLTSIRLKLNSGMIIKVRFFPERGWMVVDPPVMSSGGYLPTWEACVDECIRNNRPAAAEAPPAVRNRATESNVYYRPPQRQEQSTSGVGGNK